METQTVDFFVCLFRHDFCSDSHNSHLLLSCYFFIFFFFFPPLVPFLICLGPVDVSDFISPLKIMKPKYYINSNAYVFYTELQEVTYDP